MDHDAESYFELNREAWNKRLHHHKDSDFYDLEEFLKGKSSLNPVELEVLGNLKGKHVLHLQCHFGQDSISLAKLGAKVTAVDISDASISFARQLAERTDTEVEFICSNVYDFKGNENFDLVFTSYGTIIWLPDLTGWAGVISKSLKPGGQFVMVEFHPFINMFDNGLNYLKYDYFNSGPEIEEEKGTYADPGSDEMFTSVTWNHSMSEIIEALVSEGMILQSFREYDYSPYNCFDNLEEGDPGKFRFKNIASSIPMLYSLCALKPK